MAKVCTDWQNGYQESFFGKFKDKVGELIEAVYGQIRYYNYERIHTKLKMPPASYAESLTE